MARDEAFKKVLRVSRIVFTPVLFARAKVVCPITETFAPPMPIFWIAFPASISAR
jgi:hypothetical protein